MRDELDFFEDPMDQSLVKRDIVTKYFEAWQSVIKPHVKKKGKRMAYVDLYCGPGQYQDGTDSTPICILKKAISDPELREMLVTVFNDRDPVNTTQLNDTIRKTLDLEKLKYKPRIITREVDEIFAEIYSNIKLIPTLLFADPFGYKGLSLNLIRSFLKDWGCDCIFFFNYNRINAALTNPKVNGHMNVLFGEERANNLRINLPRMNSYERELEIIEEMTCALKELGGEFVLPFTFKKPEKAGTSHHLFFVTKHFRGYEIMKEIMANQSSSFDQGVPTFTYNLADKRYKALFELNSPLDDLEDMLLKEFAGKTMRMLDIYMVHSIGKRFVKKNYKKALLNLESEGKIVTDPPSHKRPIRNGSLTFGDKVKVIFQNRE